MSIQNKATDPYRFGPFTVDAPAGQLRKGATKIRLAGQPFEILLMLLEHPGQVITREEIQRRLWPQETFVDFENSLNKAINKLRQALSDSAEKPVYIETLPRRGYRFVGTIQAFAPEPVATQSAGSVPLRDQVVTSAPTTVSSARPFAYWRLASLSLAIPVVFLLWLGIRPIPAPHVLSVVPLTSSSRVDLYGGLHTDGVRLYFLARHGHKWELSQMPLSGGEAQPIAVPFSNARLWSVSPDGSQFAVAPFETRLSELPVWVMSSVGGTPRRLGNILVNDAVFRRDGSRITYSTKEGIFDIDVESGKIQRIISIPGDKWSLAWSPDGTRLRFHWLNEPGVPSHIWEVRADGSGLHQFLPQWNGAGGLCCGRWTPNGKYFVFLASSERSNASVWVVRESSSWFHREPEPVRLATEPLPVSGLLPSADGRKIFVLGNNTRTEFVRADPKNNQIHGLIEGQPAAWLAFSPSGDWLVFRGASNALWRSNSDGSSRVELASGNLDPRLPAVRPDGKVIAFSAEPSDATTMRIYTVPSEGGAPTEIVASKFSVTAPAWSPGGSMLSYAIDADNDPVSGLYTYDFPTRTAQKIPGSERFWRHAWSPNGKFLAAVSTANDSISLYEFSTKRWKTLARGKVFGPVSWSPDSQFLFFQDVLEQREPVHRLRLSDLSLSTTFECTALLEGGVQRCGFEGLAPDGTLVFRLSRGDHDIYAIDVDLP